MRISDWSSDVCSSDLCKSLPILAVPAPLERLLDSRGWILREQAAFPPPIGCQKGRIPARFSGFCFRREGLAWGRGFEACPPSSRRRAAATTLLYALACARLSTGETILIPNRRLGVDIFTGGQAERRVGNR